MAGGKELRNWNSRWGGRNWAFRRDLAAHRSGRKAICTLTAEGATQGGLTVERMCELSGVSRAGLYPQWQASAPRRADTALRDAVQASRRGETLLRLSAGAAGAAPTWTLGECQPGVAPDARGQSAVPANPALCASDDRLARAVGPRARGGSDLPQRFLNPPTRVV